MQLLQWILHLSPLHSSALSAILHCLEDFKVQNSLIKLKSAPRITSKSWWRADSCPSSKYEKELALEVFRSHSCSSDLLQGLFIRFLCCCQFNNYWVITFWWNIFILRCIMVQGKLNSNSRWSGELLSEMSLSFTPLFNMLSRFTNRRLLNFPPNS